TDTDNSYIGKAGFIPQVLGTENGLKLVDPNTLGHLQDLQSVTDIRNVTNNPIVIEDSSEPSANVLIRTLEGQFGVHNAHIRFSKGAFGNIIGNSIIVTDNLTNAGLTFYLPNSSGTPVMAITDGLGTEYADADGLVDISSFLGGGGTPLEIYSESGTLAGGD